mgnify:CR=1 FL=1
MLLLILKKNHQKRGSSDLNTSNVTVNQNANNDLGNSSLNLNTSNVTVNL